MKRVLLSVLAIVLISMNINAANTANSTSTVIVVTPLDVAHDTGSLNFGTISPSTAGAGTVVVDPAGVITSTGGVYLKAASGAGPDSFKVTSATAGISFTITLPSSITLSDGASHTMTVNTFTSACTPACVTVPSPATLPFKVGGTLNVTQNQVPGTYTGSYTVTLVY